MRERIAQHCGALPAPVLSKLLDVEAGELDTWLNYPKGIQAKACILRASCTWPLRAMYVHLWVPHDTRLPAALRVFQVGHRAPSFRIWTGALQASYPCQ